MFARSEDKRVFFDVVGPLLGWADDGGLMERPVIIAVPGGPGIPHVQYRPWLDRLAERYCLVYLDPTGSGLSSRPRGSTFPLAGFVEDVELVREAMGVEKIILLGHSFGGVIAQEYAATHGHRLDGLILACTVRSFAVVLESAAHTTLDDDDARVAAMMPLLQDAEPVLHEPSADRWETLDRHPAWLPITHTQFAGPVPSVWDQMLRQFPISSEPYFSILGSLTPDGDSPWLSWDRTQDLTMLDVPTLVVGAKSEAEFAAPIEQHSAVLARAIPKARLEIIQGAGHYVFAERPEAFLSIVSSFLSAAGLPGADRSHANGGDSAATPA